MGCKEKPIKVKKEDLDDTTKSLLGTIKMNSSNPTLIGQHLEMMEYFEQIRKEKERIGR